MLKRKINNKLIILGLILLLVSALCTLKIINDKYKDKKETELIIEEVFTNELEDTPTLIAPVDNQEITKSTYFNLDSNYLGYIEFSNIKRLISYGTDKSILDKNLVGVLKNSANLDDEVGNIILAGHSTINVFQKLHYSKIGDRIKIVTHTNTYDYVITEKHIIDNTDMSYFSKVNDKKILTLITCKTDKSKRLIVIAELRGNND